MMNPLKILVITSYSIHYTKLYEGLHVQVQGRGSVRKQSIPAGSRVRRGDVIKLEMSFTEG